MKPVLVKKSLHFLIVASVFHVLTSLWDVLIYIYILMCVWYEKSSLLDWSIYLFICQVASELSARGAKWIPKFTQLNCIKAQQSTLRPKNGCGIVMMMTNPLEYWHEYVEDEYHNQHVADVGRRTWQHPPTKLMAPIQRVKPARLLMSPSNTNGKQTEMKEEEETNKNSFRI